MSPLLDCVLDAALQCRGRVACTVSGREVGVVEPPNLEHLLAELLTQLHALVDRHLEQPKQDGEDATRSGAADEVEQLVWLSVGASLQVLEHSQRHKPSKAPAVDAEHPQPTLTSALFGHGGVDL